MRLRTIVAAALLAALTGPAAAHAELGPPELLTLSPREQADAVSTPALSADGRYLVFAGSLDAVTGILRKDLQTGVVDVVAGADAYGGAPVLDARMPSVSADGRYVSFTTSAALDPAHDTNEAPDVYVRDTAEAAPDDGAPCAAFGPCAFTLASAQDGSADGLSYGDTAGAVAAPRSALSADGRHVAFVVRSPSDLTSGPDGSTPGVQTPANQVAVRDLDAQRTALVSSTRDPATGAMTGVPVAGGAVDAVLPDPGSHSAVAQPLAALSADGSTVAWLGEHIDRQAPVLSDEATESSDGYDEPLWRRIADGPGAPTRRIVGGGDPLAPGCPPDGTLADPACQGPYLDLGSVSQNRGENGWLVQPQRLDGLPALSADGRTVALIGSPTLTPDLFVVDMRDGLTRRQAVRRLTQMLIGGTDADDAYDVGISPDGRRIAVTTARSTFPLAPPFFTGRAPTVPGLTELYLVDLGAQSIERVTTTVDAGPSAPGRADGGFGAGSPSFDATGTKIAFSSTASNLVPVDGNGADDAFLVTDRAAAPPGVRGLVSISPPPAPPAVPRTWRLTLRAVAQRDGSVRLDAVCPGAGLLRATVQARVPVWRTVTVRSHGHRRKVRKRVLAQRRVATASLLVRGDGLVRLPVRATAAYRALVKAKAGLDATASVTFGAPARATLRDKLAVRFHVAPAKVKVKAKPKVKAKSKSNAKGKANR